MSAHGSCGQKFEKRPWIRCPPGRGKKLRNWNSLGTFSRNNSNNKSPAATPMHRFAKSPVATPTHNKFLDKMMRFFQGSVYKWGKAYLNLILINFQAMTQCAIEYRFEHQFNFVYINVACLNFKRLQIFS